MRFLLLFLPVLLSSCGHAQPEDCISKPCSGSTNFPRDLYGPVDTRPNCWGHAEAAVLPIQFKPPAGYRVKILRLRGDLVSWPLGEPQGESTRDRYAGVLLGFSTTEPEGSTRADWFADNAKLYIQDAVGSEPRRTPFDYDDLDMVLAPDHVLALKIAVWLTSFPVHLEATATIRYQFVKM